MWLVQGHTPRESRQSLDSNMGRFPSETLIGFLSSLTIFFFFNCGKGMAPHSSTLAWKIPWTEEPGRLQSMGSLRVGHD